MAVQWLSKHRDYPTIGPNLMGVCLPRTSVENFERTGIFFASSGAPDETSPTFLYVPGEGVSPITFGPIFVVGQTILTTFEAGSL